MFLKKRGLVKTLSVVVIAGVLTAGLSTYSPVTVSYAQQNQSETRIHELERDLRNAQEEDKKLKDQLKNAQNNAASYEAEIEQLDNEIGILTKQLALVEDLYDEWLKDKEATEARIKELEKQRDEEYDVFDAMLRVSYQYGTDTYFNIIFGSQDIGDFLSRADLIGYHLKANKNVLSNLSNTLKDLESTMAQYEESMSAIEEYGKQQEELKLQLEERSEYALQKKLEYEADAAKLKAQVDAKSAEMAQMQAEILRHYEQQRANGNIQAYTGGSFLLPLAKGTYRISSEFTHRINPINGRPENHNGLDMAAPGGTPIYAAASGKVIVSTYSNSWGNVIQIDHGGGLVTLYAHCSYRGVTVGQMVAAGQEIGRVGTTGWSTGNHLHFTVYKNGVAQNPRNYLSNV